VCKGSEPHHHRAAAATMAKFKVPEIDVVAFVQSLKKECVEIKSSIV
jgi:hypothetical protein